MASTSPPTEGAHDVKPANAEHAWPQMSPEEEEELCRDFVQAEEDEQKGVPGLSVDDVLPRYRRAG
jgi:hypothetical protein